MDPFIPVGVSSTFAEGKSRVEGSGVGEGLKEGVGEADQSMVFSSADLPPSYLQVDEGWPIAEPKGSLTDAKYMI